MHNKLSLIFFVFLLLCAFYSCNKSNDEVAKEKDSEDIATNENIAIEEKQHTYYISHSLKGKKNADSRALVKEVSGVDKVPKKNYSPWTESVRFSGMGFFNNEPYFIVNKIGVISFSNILSKSFVFSSNSFFPFFTASGFYNTDVGLLIASYKNTMFENIGSFESPLNTLNEELPILNRYNLITQDIEPILFPHHFALPSYASMTSLSYNDGWFASFKIDNGEGVQFRYFKFNQINDLLNANYQTIESDAFMKNMSPLLEGDSRFSSLPEPLLYLIEHAEEKSLTIEYFDSNYPSSIKIVKTPSKASSFEETEHQAVSFSNSYNNKICYSLLLDTGKLYVYDGDDKAPNTYLLPSLPKDFVYTYFSIYGNFVIACWEEQDFFECGRVGFTLIPLSKLNVLALSD